MAIQTARIEINGNILHLNHPTKQWYTIWPCLCKTDRRARKTQLRIVQHGSLVEHGSCPTDDLGKQTNLLRSFWRNPNEQPSPEYCVVSLKDPNQTQQRYVVVFWRKCGHVFASLHGQTMGSSQSLHASALQIVRLVQRLLTDQDSTNEKTIANGILSYETTLTSDSHGYAVCVHKLSRTES